MMIHSFLSVNFLNIRIFTSIFLLIWSFNINAQNQKAKITSVSGIHFYEYLPPDYTTSKNDFPVVIFLHGLAERGDTEKSLALIEKHGPPKHVKAGYKFPFILISPQLKTKYTDWPVSYIDEVLEYVKTTLKINASRIYLTGLSLGGGGTWMYAQDPVLGKKLAAIAVVCGSRNTPAKAVVLANNNLPVWAFHGDADTKVDFNKTIKMVDAINACTPPPSPLAIKTIYSGITHSSWNNAYRIDNSLHDPNVYEWLLQWKNPHIPMGVKSKLSNQSNLIETPKPKPVKKTLSKNEVLHEIGDLPKNIKEASGLEMTGGKYLWTHNDGGIPMLYCLDTLGRFVKSVQLNHPNKGWEDLTQDEKGNLYVGSFGNNDNNRKDLKIYKLPNIDTNTAYIVNAEVINFKYSDQKDFPPPQSKRNFDMDAFASYKGSLYLFSKNRTKPFTGYTKIYKLSQVAGTHVAQLIDSIYLGKEGAMLNYWITGADFSPNGKRLALLSHDYILLIRDFKGDLFSSGKIQKIDLKNFSHKAGICFQTNEKLYIVDELELDILGGKLYSMDLSHYLK